MLLRTGMLFATTMLLIAVARVEPWKAGLYGFSLGLMHAFLDEQDPPKSA